MRCADLPGFGQVLSEHQRLLQRRVQQWHLFGADLRGAGEQLLGKLRLLQQGLCLGFVRLAQLPEQRRQVFDR